LRVDRAATSVHRPWRLCGSEEVGLFFIVADAAPQVDDRGDEAHLRNWRFVGTRLWKHVADLIDLALLRPVVEFRAVHLAGSVLQGPDIRPQKLFCIVAGDGNDLSVAEIEAEWIDVAIEEAGFSLVDLVDRLGLVRFQSGNRLVSMALASAAVPNCSASFSGLS
jgi:hypothetical protein